MINHYDNETRLTAILRCVVDDTADAAMLLQLGPARTREEIFISRALGKKPWAAIPPRTTLEMWLAFIAEDEAEPAPGSYTVRSCAESCIITYARHVKGASAIVPIFPPHDPYEIALAKLAGIIPVGYGVQGRPWELLINQMAGQGPRKSVELIYGSTPKREGGQITPMQDMHGYARPWAGGSGKNLFDGQFEQGTFDNHGAPIASTTRLRTGFIPISAGRFTLSIVGGSQVLNEAFVYDENKAFSRKVLASPTTTAKVLINTGEAFIRFSVRYSDNATIIPDDAAPCQLEIGPTATAWSPYSNICPIVPGLDMLMDNGNRFVVWSGEINSGSGEIISRSAEIVSYAGEQLPGPWISSMDAYTIGTTPTIGAQVVYELDEPVIYHLTQTELRRALGCTKYLGVGAWKLCPGVVTVITARLTTGATTTRYDLSPSETSGWSFEISADGQTATGATGALSVAAGDHSVTITATPAAGAAACYIQPTLYSEVTP